MACTAVTLQSAMEERQKKQIGLELSLQTP